MTWEDIYPAEELRKRLHRYCWDEQRYLPIKLFAQECACSVDLFTKVFKYQTANLTKHMQIRASRVLKNWENGAYKIMQNKKGDVWLEYRDSPKARLRPSCQLILRENGIGLKLGMVNKSDYGDKEEFFDAIA